MWGSFGSSGFTKRHYPYPETVTVTDFVIKWAHGSSPHELEEYHVNWIALTIKSTFERPFHPDVLYFVIQGPVYHSDEIGYSANGGFISKLEHEADGGAYVGERRMIVKLIPIASVPLLMAYDDPRKTPWPMPVIPAAERKFLTPWQPPVPEEAEFLYVVVPPRARLLPDDKVTTCTIDEQEKNVDLRIEWVGQNVDMPLVKLADTQVDDGAVRAILAAAH